MDGKEAIIARIIEDAEGKADKIRAEAAAKNAEVISDAQSWAESYLTAQRGLLAAETDNLVSRRVTVADLDYRKSLLAAKREVIDAVYKKALDKLCALDKKSYLAFLDKLIAEYGEKGDKLILPEAAPVKPDEADALPSCKKLGIKTAGKGAFRGGVMLVNDVCDKDLSFEILVNALKAETEAETAEKLFGKND